MMKLEIITVLLLVLVGICQPQTYRPYRPPARNKLDKLAEKEKRLPNDQCGKQNIIGMVLFGGKNAALGEYPWMAEVGYTTQGESPTDITWRCGGSLITDQYVITAAHCLDKPKYVPTKVRLGELNFDPAVNDGAFPRDYDIDSFEYHKNWTTKHQVNDIGLIKLKEKVNFTDFVRPICLPPTNLKTPMFSQGDYPFIAGWGRTEFSSGSMALLKVRVKVANQTSCREKLTELTKDDKEVEIKIDDSVLCAGTKGKDACAGDSGGPLMLFYQPKDGKTVGKQYLIGVVSYGIGCGFNHPGVYTRVSYHMPWILEHLDI